MRRNPACDLRTVTNTSHQENRMEIRRKQMLLAVFAALAASQLTPALAQQKVEKIEVTGSNIKRIDSEGVAPVQVITKTDIEQTGKSTVAEVLRSISANSANSLNEVFTNSFSPGASGLSLRGLGQKSTLVLLNGRRMANYGFAQNLQDTYVDLNTIPSAAVERIEVLKDGASAVYGSDAIGGVVNIILRNDYRGVEIGASMGTSTEGGLDETRVSLAAGFGDIAKNRYNVLTTVDYFKRDQLLASERDFTKDQDTRRFNGGLLNWPSIATYRTATRQAFSTCGVNNPGVVIPGSQIASNGTVCAYNPASFIPLFPESERLSILARGTFEFSPTLSAFAEFAFSSNESKQTFTPAAVSPTSVAFDPATQGIRIINGTLPVGNPSNPFTAPVGINYAFFDVGPRASKIDSESFRAMAGVKGSLGKWDWEAAAGKAENEVEQINYNRVDSYKLVQAIANGSYNFLNPSAGTTTANDLRINPTRNSTSKLDIVDFKASTELMQLSAGPLGFATGIEHRRESISDRPDFLLTNGNVLGQGATQTEGSRTNTAGFFEFALPATKELEFQIAGRYDRYSDFGNAFSPKAGFKFSPSKTVALRGSVSRGFRAPTLPENAKSSSTFFTGVVDTLATSPNFNRTVTIAGVFSGNQDLKAERSRNYNLGIVFEPTNDFNVGLTWYKIEQTNVVSSSGFQFIVSNPDLFPGQILRAADGTLVSVSDKFQNLSEVQTSGVDIDFRKSFKLGGGKLTLNGDWVYVSYFKAPPAAGQTLVDYVDSNGYPPSGGGIPRYKGRLGMTWEQGAWSTTLTRIYNHSWDEQAVATPPANARVGAYQQYDLYVSYDGFKNLKLYTSIQNLLDKEPPFAPNNGGTGTTVQYDISQNDLRGRYVTVGAKYTFK
jgi:iron complex outermembrane recepter protein